MISSQTFRLDGRLALVTGSSTGAGLALARGRIINICSAPPCSWRAMPRAS
jgi:hypothetical protein